MEPQVEYTHYFLGVAFVRSQYLEYLAIDSWPDSCVGCCASNSDHHIPVLITEDQYQAVIIDAGVTNAELFRVGLHPKLELSGKTSLHCLHGEARLRNARLDKSRGGEWLCVDLYQAKASNKVQRHLRQLYQRHTALCDGDIYLTIRFHQRQQNHSQAERWLTKMSVSKRKIFGQVRRNASISAALDDLEALPAIWKKLQLGSFPPILSWRCHEEIGNYLRAIFLGWKAICGDNYHWCDEKTIQRIEGLAPGWSLQHKSVIEDLGRQGQLFHRIETAEERDATIRRVLDQKGLVLSFGTFYKHTKLLENTMLGVRRMFPPRSFRSTVMTAFRSICSSSDKAQALVQYSDEDERHIVVPGLTKFETGYLQVVLFGLRNRDAMAFPKTRKEWANTSETPDWLIRMACLISKLGFESDEIADLQKLDPDCCRIRHHMRLERPYSTFTVSMEDFELEASRRHHEQRIFSPRKEDNLLPPMATALGTEVSRRQSLQNLFLPSISNALQRKQCNQILTRFGQEVLALCAFYDYFVHNIGKTNNATFATRTSSTPIVAQQSPGPSGIATTSSIYSNHNNEIPVDSQRDSPDMPVGGEPNTGRVVNRSRRISFFQLKTGQPPRMSHSCPASSAEVRATMHELRTSCKDIVFLLFHRGRLMISAIADIQRHCVRHRRLNSVYYVTDTNSGRFWVGRSMNDAKKWGSYYRTGDADLRVDRTLSEEPLRMSL